MALLSLEELRHTFNVPDKTGALEQLMQEYLAIVEQKFGQRDQHTQLVIQFHDGGPYVHLGDGIKWVKLSRNAEDNVDNAIFELAHETVHLLSSATCEEVTVLEEGMATHFQEEMNGHYGVNICWQNKPYEDAWALFKTALSFDSEFVKRAREQTGRRICELTSKDILQASPDMPPDLADKLCANFHA